MNFDRRAALDSGVLALRVLGAASTRDDGTRFDTRYGPDARFCARLLELLALVHDGVPDAENLLICYLRQGMPPELVGAAACPEVRPTG
uniref:Uncharacterized protein n=1 Tax=viral metagenome TaxID=1070528 RepID=A0A6M3M1Q0_9ZZZZ